MFHYQHHDYHPHPHHGVRESVDRFHQEEEEEEDSRRMRMSGRGRGRPVSQQPPQHSRALVPLGHARSATFDPDDDMRYQPHPPRHQPQHEHGRCRGASAYEDDDAIYSKQQQQQRQQVQHLRLEPFHDEHNDTKQQAVVASKHQGGGPWTDQRGTKPLPCNEFYKRTLCRHFATGSCRFGVKCRFAHGQGELRQHSNSQQQQQQVQKQQEEQRLHNNHYAKEQRGPLIHPFLLEEEKSNKNERVVSVADHPRPRQELRPRPPLEQRERERDPYHYHHAPSPIRSSISGPNKSERVVVADRPRPQLRPPSPLEQERERKRERERDPYHYYHAPSPIRSSISGPNKSERVVVADRPRPQLRPPSPLEQVRERERERERERDPYHYYHAPSPIRSSISGPNKSERVVVADRPRPQLRPPSPPLEQVRERERDPYHYHHAPSRIRSSTFGTLVQEENDVDGEEEEEEEEEEDIDYSYYAPPSFSQHRPSPPPSLCPLVDLPPPQAFPEQHPHIHHPSSKQQNDKRDLEQPWNHRNPPRVERLSLPPNPDAGHCPDLRIHYGSNKLNEYNKLLSRDDIVLVPALFGDEDDTCTFQDLFHEMQDILAREQKYKFSNNFKTLTQQLQQPHNRDHFFVHAKGSKQSATCNKIVQRVCRYFDLDQNSLGCSLALKKGSRAEAFRKDFDKFPNHPSVTITVMFGATREMAFLHESSSLALQQQKDRSCRNNNNNSDDGSSGLLQVYVPLPNNAVLCVGRGVCERWVSGMSELALAPNTSASTTERGSDSSILHNHNDVTISIIIRGKLNVPHNNCSDSSNGKEETVADTQHHHQHRRQLEQEQKRQEPTRKRPYETYKQEDYDYYSPHLHHPNIKAASETNYYAPAENGDNAPQQQRSYSTPWSSSFADPYKKRAETWPSASNPNIVTISSLSSMHNEQEDHPDEPPPRHQDRYGNHSQYRQESHDHDHYQPPPRQYPHPHNEQQEPHEDNDHVSHYHDVLAAHAAAGAPHTPLASTSVAVTTAAVVLAAAVASPNRSIPRYHGENYHESSSSFATATATGANTSNSKHNSHDSKRLVSALSKSSYTSPSVQQQQQQETTTLISIHSTTTTAAAAAAAMTGTVTPLSNRPKKRVRFKLEE